MVEQESPGWRGARVDDAMGWCAGRFLPIAGHLQRGGKGEICRDGRFFSLGGGIFWRAGVFFGILGTI